MRCKSILVCDARERTFTEQPEGEVSIWEEPKAYHSYILSADVSEGIDGDYSVAKVKDAKKVKLAGAYVTEWNDKLQLNLSKQATMTTE